MLVQTATAIWLTQYFVKSNVKLLAEVKKWVDGMTELVGSIEKLIQAVIDLAEKIKNLLRKK